MKIASTLDGDHVDTSMKIASTLDDDSVDTSMKIASAPVSGDTALASFAWAHPVVGAACGMVRHGRSGAG
jgi:hypothetical protein